MPRSKEKSKVTETPEAPVEVAPEVDPVAEAQAQAEAIIEAAKREAELLRKAANEEARAKTEKAGDWQTVPEGPAPTPQPGTIVTPEPSVSEDARAGKAAGKVYETGIPGITVTQY